VNARFVSLAMSALLLASPLVMAEVTQTPAPTGMGPAAEPVGTEQAPSTETTAPQKPEGMTKNTPDATKAGKGPGASMPMDMMGTESKGGTMKSGMPGDREGQTPMMGGAGMMNMMDMGMKGGMKGGGDTDTQHYREVMGRLDLLDARLSKIDAMLERPLQR